MTRQGATLPLVLGNRTTETTLESVLNQEEDYLLQLGFPEQRLDFFLSLYSNRDGIAQLASYHLGLGASETCQTGDIIEWLNGSFNVCIPLYVSKQGQDAERRALIRFPLPYKVGEFKNPGNVDEKLRCEAATFIWMHHHCPEVSIPQLWGFGLVGGQSFTKPQNISWGARLIWYLKRSFKWFFRGSLPCAYACHQRSILSETGYLLMDYIGNSEVQMLSKTWDENRHQKEKRTNLFKGLSRIMLSLSQIPMPSIGSWTLDDNGVLRFSNRPLTLELHKLENGGVPTHIGRTLTYSAPEAYYRDLLSCHDSRIRYQPNSIHDANDGRGQMARLTMMRALIPHFSKREYRGGPFFYTLTDLVAHNIFVDSDWNIRYVVDLEWACSLPAETLLPPYWLTGQSVDNLTGENLDVFKETYAEFVDIFEKEEKCFPPIENIDSYRTSTMRKALKDGSFWYFSALNTTKGLYNVFQQHIYPIFASSNDAPPEFDLVAAKFWAPDVEEVLAAKLRDKEEYEQSLHQLFDEAANSVSNTHSDC